MFTLKKSILGYMELKPIQFQFRTNVEQSINDLETKCHIMMLKNDCMFRYKQKNHSLIVFNTCGTLIYHGGCFENIL